MVFVIYLISLAATSSSWIYYPRCSKEDRGQAPLLTRIQWSELERSISYDPCKHTSLYAAAYAKFSETRWIMPPAERSPQHCSSLLYHVEWLSVRVMQCPLIIIILESWMICYAAQWSTAYIIRSSAVMLCLMHDWSTVLVSEFQFSPEQMTDGWVFLKCYTESLNARLSTGII